VTASVLISPKPTPGAVDLRDHIPALDAVRGVAILLVLIFHFGPFGLGLTSSSPFIDRLDVLISRAGWIGVDLFFVLSGFLITGILYDAKRSKHYFRNFYVRRVLRIFPLYYGALLIFLVVLPWLLAEHAGVQLMKRDAIWYWTYLSNVRIAYNGWPGFGAIGHFWSLAVEEQFYLVWPVIVLALSPRHLQAACLACVIGALAVRVGLNVEGNETAAFVLTPARIDALAVGAYLAISARGPTGLRRISRWALPSAALLSGALLAIFVLRKGFVAQDPIVSTVGHTLLACLFGAILVLALTSARDSFIGSICASSFLCFFGRYSYALYVFHHPMLFFRPGAIPLTVVPTIGGSQLLRQLVFLILATGVSVSIAVVSWHLYEKQFLKLKKLFPYQSREKIDSPLVLGVDK